MGQEPGILERGELVSHRRGRDIEPVPAHELGRGDRLGRRDVLAYDRAKHLSRAWVEVRKLSRIRLLRQISTLLSRVLRA